MPASAIQQSHVIHHDDGTKTINHYHRPVAIPESNAAAGDHSHAVADLNGMNKNFQRHLQGKSTMSIEPLPGTPGSIIDSGKTITPRYQLPSQKSPEQIANQREIA